MARPHRADTAAQKRIDAYRAAHPKTFDQLCAEFNVNREERAELGFRLAQIRYERTLAACGLDIGYLRASIQEA